MEPRIEATDDSNFVISWRRYEDRDDGSLNDIYYTVRNTGGYIVKPITQYTYDTPGSSEGYVSPNLAKLFGNRVLVTFRRNSDGYIQYGVLDSAGNPVKGHTTTGGYGNAPDAVQLSGGNILIAMSNSMKYVILDSAYNVISGPTYLYNPSAITGEFNVSVTADDDDHAVLSWVDDDWYNPRYLFYALIDGSGVVVTDPMIFYTSPVSDSYVQAGHGGYGNTSYGWLAAADVDGLAVLNTHWFGAPPGGGASLGVEYGNRGGTPAENVSLTATLDPNLIYLSDTSGISPQVNANLLTWQFPDLSYLDGGSFVLRLGVPSSPFGTTYPVSITIATDGPEANPADNSDSAPVEIAFTTYMPILLIK